MCVPFCLVLCFVGHSGELMVENGQIRVVVDSRSAAWRVVDKRIGHTWRQALPAVLAGVAVPKAASAIAVDGDLADWAWLAARAAVVGHVTVGKQGDCRAAFRTTWAKDRLYFAVDVADDQYVEPPSAAKFWLGDSVELWTGGDQFGVGMVGGKPFVTCYNRPQAATGAKAAIGRRAGGWTCEVALPVGQLAGTVARRQRTPLAVGVNDADAAGKRRAQLYYPTTWKQWNPSTYALARFVDRVSDRLVSHEAVSAMLPTRCSAHTCDPRRRTIAVTVPGLTGPRAETTATFELDAKSAEVLVTLSAPADGKMTGVAFPEPLLVATPAAAWVVPTQEGLLYRVRGDEHVPGNFRSMMSMTWMGGLDMDRGLGYLILPETPDDMFFRKQKVAAGDETLWAAVPYWQAQKGKFGCERRVRYVFFDRGGYVAMCKRYRAHARAVGMVRTLEEKARDVPNVRKLAGAVNVWYPRRGANAAKLGEVLKSLGVDRCLMHISSVGYRPKKETVEALHGLGYLVGHYDIYTDLHESGHPWDTWDRYKQYRFPDPVIRKADGSLQQGWYTIYDKGEPYRSCVVCPRCGLDAMRKRVPADHEATGHSVWFVDCATSCGLYECYHPDHPVTRGEDKLAKLAQFEFLHGRGLVCGSEGGRDWALRYCSYFEGLMSTACWRATPKNMGSVQGPLDVTGKYMEFDHGPNRRLPLWELVHHDASCVTWWWGDGQLREPDNWGLKDLWHILYGTMPLWMMREEGEQLFINNPNAFRDSFARVSPVTRTAFGVEMVDHEILSDDGNVQRTRWANGLSITVNFGPAAGALPGFSYRVDGGSQRFSDLPIGKAIAVPRILKLKKPEGLPNTDFSVGTFGWWAAPGMNIATGPGRTPGKLALRIAGTDEKSWNIGGSACLLRLEPGKRYRFGAWVKLVSLDPLDRPPMLALGITGSNRWITNIHTRSCAPQHLGEWQWLERSFVCPDGAEKGRFNIEKRSKAVVAIELLLAEPLFRAE